MARRKQQDPKAFTPALEKIDQMERAVVRRMVSVDGITPSDILEWCLPDDVVRIMRAAFPYRDRPCGDFAFRPTIPSLPDVQFFLRLDMDRVQCLKPNDVFGGYQDTRKAPLIVGVLKEVAGIVTTHDRLRKVVRFFDDNLTPSAARHYFPALGALLPEWHVFHTLDGRRFTETYIPPDVTEYIREGQTTIAAGLLCDPSTHGTAKLATWLVRLDSTQGGSFNGQVHGFFHDD